MASVSPTCSPVSVRRAAAVICSWAATGPAVPYNARTSAPPVANAAVGAVAGLRAIAYSWMPVDPVVRGTIEGGVGQPRALSHVRELMPVVAAALLASEVGEVGEVGGGIRSSHGGG